MNEIEKMYENAEVQKKYDCTSCEYLSDYICPKCTDKQLKYPPFTAEKQLELIKWLSKTRPIHINLVLDNWVIEGMIRYGKKYDTFENALGGYLNQIWQDLTDEEQKQIRNILNENH